MMVLAMSLVPLIDVLAKFLVLDGIPALQVVFLRMLLGTLLLLPVMLLYRRPEIVPPQEGVEGYEGYESPSPTPEILEPTPTPAWDPLPTPTPAFFMEQARPARPGLA